jgi:hypothetical protein
MANAELVNNNDGTYSVWAKGTAVLENESFIIASRVVDELNSIIVFTFDEVGEIAERIRERQERDDRVIKAAAMYDRIQAGAYKVQTPYPTRPVKPAIFNKKVGDLTADELKSLPELQRRHAEDQICYQQGTNAYHAEQARLEAEFKEDLFAEFGVSNNPLREKAYEMAYASGHSSGYAEIYNHFSDLAELINIDVKTLTEMLRNHPQFDGTILSKK